MKGLVSIIDIRPQKQYVIKKYFKEAGVYGSVQSV